MNFSKDLDFMVSVIRIYWRVLYGRIIYELYIFKNYILEVELRFLFRLNVGCERKEEIIYR